MKQRKFLAWMLTVVMLLSMFGGLGITSYAEESESAVKGLSSLVIYTERGADVMESSALLGAENESYPNRVIFSPDTYDYTLPSVDDSVTQLRFAPMVAEEGATVKLVYNEDGEMKEKEFESTNSFHWKNWANCIKPGENSVSLVITEKDESETIYTFTLNVYPTLNALTFYNGEKELYLNKAFDANTTQYAITVKSGTESIKTKAGIEDSNYVVTYDGEESSDVTITSKSAIEVTVASAEGAEALATTYEVTLNWAVPYSVTINTQPTDAIASLFDTKGIAISKAEGGSFSDLLEGSTYTYVVTKKGYVAKSGTVTGAGIFTVALEEAPENTNPLPSYTGDWVNLRGNDANMGITDVKTPINPDKTVLKWNEKYGTGWAAAPTPPIVVNNELYIGMSNKVVRLNKETGEKLAESQEMVGTVGYAMNPITYAEGMIFVAVGDGQIQALRADTLESLWVSEEIDGQTVCPTTYHDGYIYTGTWNKEDKDGVYYCLSVTDEDPLRTNETKLCSWKLNHFGGFYWAGAYATDNYVIFGSDDGSAEGSYIENAILYSCDSLTGEVLDTIEGIKGDIRSTIAYDKDTDRIYFSTKGGWFYTVKVNDDGTFDKTTKKVLELGGMCTGTPLVYNGLAYIGVSGPSQFSAEGHSYKIIDVTTDPMNVVATADIPGYVQSSAMLSTGYVADTNKVYVYSTYNYNPGGIYMIEVEKTENVDENGAAVVNTKGSHLFVPQGNLAQYCICSLVCDKDGTIYYKNDSCNIMAIAGNNASLTDLTVSGGGASILPAFSRGVYNYEVIVDPGTKEVTVQGTPEEGSTVLVNENENSAVVALVDGTATATVVVQNGEDHLTYTVNILEKSNDATLSELYTNISNCPNSDEQSVTPAFDATITDYVVSNFDERDWDSFNIWANSTNEDAKVEVKADGVALEHEGRGRYRANWDDKETISFVITVTAEDAVTQNVYNVVVSKNDKNLTGISISKGPSKVSYKEGELFDTTGMEITAQYNYKSTEVVTGWSVDEKTLTKNDKTVVIHYQGKTADQAITVTPKSSGGGSSHGSSGGSGSSAVDTNTNGSSTEKKSTNGTTTVTSTMKTEAKTTKDGKAAATVSKDEMSSSLKQAVEAAKKDGKNTLAEVKLEIKADKKATQVEASLPTAAVKDVAKTEHTQLTVATPVGDLTFDRKALEAIGQAAEGTEVKISATQVDRTAVLVLKKLPELTRPVYDLSMHSNGEKITSFNKGKVTVSLPYTLARNEKAANVCIYYIDDKGNKTRVADAYYDSKAKKVIFTTNHFSYYAVGYEESAASTGTQFTDVRNKDWYAESVMTLVNKGIVKGKTQTTFAPNANITRAEFTQILYGMAKAADTTMNVDASKIADKFKDVKKSDWYANAVSWASEQGVVSGISNADGSMNFVPNAKITRQDMAVMIQNYQSKVVKKELIAVNQEINFTDENGIANYAKTAVLTMQKAGILSGVKAEDGSYYFAPKNNATRAEAATMISKLF